MSSMAIQRKRRLVVMAMTADVFSTNSEKIAAGKMDGFITKPIDEYQLYRALKAI
jgi:CheY-like chemotaxis protein